MATQSNEWVLINTADRANELMRVRSERVFAIAWLMNYPLSTLYWRPGQIDVGEFGSIRPDFFILDKGATEEQGTFIEVTSLDLSKHGSGGKHIANQLRHKLDQRDKLDESGFPYHIFDRAYLEEWIHMSIDEFDRRYGWGIKNTAKQHRQ